MSPQYGTGPNRRPTRRGWLALPALAFFVACAGVLPARAQNTFNSGSTGADGAFAPTSSQTIQVPESGVFNFTTVTIPSFVTIRFQRNSRNSPVTILASGNVSIDGGFIILDGQDGNANGGGGAGGSGGFNGGASGYGFDAFPGVTGDGPGGGSGGGSVNGASVSGGGGGGYASAGGGAGHESNATGGEGGPRYGASALQPLVGGSGGGGGGAYVGNHGGSGGGGGGAILIASSGTISFSCPYYCGTITARGGNGQGNYYQGGSGGGGAGGGIRLVANTVTGSGSFDVGGGSGGYSYNGLQGGAGAPGYIRVEAYNYSSFNSSSNPSSVSIALPHPVVVTNAPQLRIASVAGLNSPAAPVGSLRGVPDIIVPTTQPNPVSVVLQGANVPVGTVVQVILTPESGGRTTAQSGALAGTDAASTATASVSLPAGMSVITATATIDLTTAKAQPVFIEGERVNRIEVAATFGGPSEVTYITQSGRRIRRVGN